MPGEGDPGSIPAQASMQVVLMGVSGSGKTTIGRLLADRLGWRFADADDYHPPKNVEKMAAGIALNDADRLPWLADLRAYLAELQAGGQSSVMACSALKSAYREQLSFPFVRFFFLTGPKELIAGRIAKRAGHYMPESLLDSQFAALEEPAPEEGVLVVDIEHSPDQIVKTILAHLALDKPEKS